MLLTTHYMFEADALCDRIAVISKGKIVAEGTPADLEAAESVQGSVLEVEVFGVATRRSIERVRARSAESLRSRSRSESRRRCWSCRPEPDVELTSGDPRPT